MDKDLASLRKFLDASTEKKVATETLSELAAIGTTFATIFVVDLQKRILEDTELQLCIV